MLKQVTINVKTGEVKHEELDIILPPVTKIEIIDQEKLLAWAKSNGLTKEV